MANPARHAGATRRTAWRPLAVAVTGGALLMTAGFGVWASLNATAFNASPQSVSSGTLSLTLADNGAGFSSNITNMAPGDVVDRYVNLTNGGTLAAKALTMSIAATGSSALITDGTSPATKALTVAVNSCSTSWTAATGVCASSGTVTSLLSATTLSGLSSAQSLIAGSIAVNEVEHLQIVVTLPDQTETTTNGSAPGTTIQGQSADLTYTFNESQRNATTTDS
ncbi:MAG TPA: TasA family protein [Mycobacteriales bacterium]|nr:TasA family protein [Mycobacteriales bacterium]HVY08783.1 TasA family protein [Mycobacteriales bacterium]